jgi:hypothetical protein
VKTTTTTNAKIQNPAKVKRITNRFAHGENDSVVAEPQPICSDAVMLHVEQFLALVSISALHIGQWVI